MVTRSFPNQELSYSRLLQVPDDCHNDNNDFFTIQELDPPGVQVQQSLASHYQPDYYELPNMLDLNSSASHFNYHQGVSMSSDSGAALDVIPEIDSPGRSSRKRKASLTETTSDVEDDSRCDDTKSVKTTDENKKQNHSEIEKRRRDKMNTYITELSSMVPMCHAMSRKLDKLTVLRMAVQHIKSIKGSVNSYTEGNYKPPFLTEQELKHLVLQAADGFLFVVGCDRGRLLYVSESVSQYLNYNQGDLLGQSLFDILHPKDVAKVKEQLSSSDLNPRERLIDAKTMLPVKTDMPQGITKFSPGARRSFFCRMKSKPSSSQVKQEADTTNGYNRRKKSQNPDKKYTVIYCTGYLKSWTPAKVGLDENEAEWDADSCNLSCLTAIARLVPPVNTTNLVNQRKPNVPPFQFTSRHTLDGKFLYVDQKATVILGFLPQELLGTSMYEYYHHEDIQLIAEYHKCALQTMEKVTTKPYRFRTKDKGHVQVQTEWKAFKNPWTKEIECLIAKNNIVLIDSRVVESSAGCEEGLPENFDFFTQSPGKDMERIINTHIEASKIGRQIADQVMDLQRQNDSLSNSPELESESLNASANGESHISTTDQPQTLLMDFNHQQHQQTFTTPRHTDPVLGGTIDDNVMDMMEETIRDAPNQGSVRTDGNDEAAMAVIMSLLEADAGLGGPVDFSGLPWPLP